MRKHVLTTRPTYLAAVLQDASKSYVAFFIMHYSLKIIGKQFQRKCYKTIFRKINTEEIFFQLTLITNKDYFSRKKGQFAKIYCRGIYDLYLWVDYGRDVIIGANNVNVCKYC